MTPTPNIQEEFDETLESLIEDVILLDALHNFEADDCTPLLRSLYQDFSPQTRRRILDYLDQHAADLYHIAQYTKKAQET